MKNQRLQHNGDGHSSFVLGQNNQSMTEKRGRSQNFTSITFTLRQTHTQHTHTHSLTHTHKRRLKIKARILVGMFVVWLQYAKQLQNMTPRATCVKLCLFLHEKVERTFIRGGEGRGQSKRTIRVDGHLKAQLQPPTHPPHSPHPLSFILQSFSEAANAQCSRLLFG